MLASYRAVLSRPGALPFSLAGLIGRLPISMIGLGLVLLVEDATGSYGSAGVVSAAYVLGNAALAILSGRLIDRFGQGRVLPVMITISALSLGGTVWAVQDGLGAPVPHLLAALSGATMPQIGSCVRARWVHLLGSDPKLHTAFSYEAVMDETVFITGPILVTVLATSVHPVAGIATAAACGLLGGWALAAQRRTEPPTRASHRTGGPRTPMPWRLLAVLVGCSAMLGGVFGGAEVATVAFADEQGRAVWAGPLLGLWAAGSLLAGIAYGAITWRSGSLTRFRVAAAALALSLLVLPFIGSLAVLAPVLLLAGFAISPTLISLTALVAEQVPASRLTEGLAVVHAGMAAGIAPGAALVGTVIDNHGASTSYLVVCAAGVVGALLTWVVPAGPAAPPPSPAPVREPEVSA
ncbi:MFS transporter [Nocardioides massiliensis]|uniref:MFS family arabinose efflux permease n=1 Tax=Nocardioides massiliensis TaxID=1325935 RepID=A0ABT9NQN7_9ACTN|nr:MFS transporter [Nocardioides massiliensis]MDP9822739.1 putative MFS family arabinose efflux permease [Nocardioides massiliensis]